MDLKVDCDDNNMTRETISSQDLSHQMDIQMTETESLEHTSGSGHNEAIPVDETNFSANDLEALANIQEELDRLTAEQVDTQEVTHAMITEDGTAVPLTLNAETGEYMTHDGHIVVSGNSTSHHQEETIMPDTSDLSSLAAAAETHEGMGITMDDHMEVDERVLSNHQLVTVGSDGHHIVLGGGSHPVTSATSLQQHSINVVASSNVTAVKTEVSQPRKIQPQIKLVSSSGVGNMGSNTIRIAPSTNVQGGSVRFVNSDGTLSSMQNQNIQVLNPDGTLSALQDSIGQNIRFVTSDGSMIQLAQPQEVQIAQPVQQQPQQVRIMNPDGTVTIGSPITLRSSIPTVNQTQQIRILNSDDSQQIRIINANDASGLSPGSFRIITSGNQLIGNTTTTQQQQQFDGGTRVRFVNSNVHKSPVKAITLSQAQQMGLLSGGASQGAFKIMPKSPINIRSPQKFAVGSTIRTADGKTIIIGSPQKQQQQIIIRPSTVGGIQQQVQTKENITQQIIRIPASSKSETGIQQISSGSKVQYVRVISTQAQSTSPRTQMVTVKSGTPILPATVKTGGTIPVAVKQMSSHSNVVKIALPPTQQQQLVRTSSAPAGHMVTGAKTQRIILPSPASFTSSDSLIQTKVITIPDNKPISTLAEIQPKADLDDMEGGDDDDHSETDDDSPDHHMRPIVTNSHAYEAFLNKKEEKPKVSSSSGSAAVAFEPSGVRPRKPCNCTKSQCLKLYCDCFANGEFCFNCNCTNCFNNLHHERQRQKSIKQCLDRNPSAFRPKIGRAITDGERRHNKGCNCKRSGCLKNYCECYEAKIPCTDSCKCIGCKNLEDEDMEAAPVIKKEVGAGNASHNAVLTSSITSSGVVALPAAISAAQARKSQSLKARLAPFSGNSAFKPIEGVKQPFSFVTTEVVEATCQCLLAQAEEAERKGATEQESEGMVIEEFGRCLKQIIEIAKKTNSTNNGETSES